MPHHFFSLSYSAKGWFTTPITGWPDFMEKTPISTVTTLRPLEVMTWSPGEVGSSRLPLM